ncbi:cytochrome c maturation protein CcmE [Caldimonas sp. KR1-144]|uniref:cytochrome c maturation protein CcmE n=1 Tax=Caldimonas sp. KR1-144 TaxID=3400911 RepID=UPI003BFC6450
MRAGRRRLALAACVLCAIGVAVGLVLYALNSNLVFFYSPSQVAANEAPAQRVFRIGGLVERGSVRSDGLDVAFVVTDTAHSVAVRFRGVLPDLFQEGRGVVAQGRLAADGVFLAHEVLAKHDETYTAPAAARALKAAEARP